MSPTAIAERPAEAPPSPAPPTTSLPLAPAPPSGPFVRRHPVLAYYLLTFAISWGGVLLVIGGPGGIPATQDQLDRLFPLAVVALLLGPSAAGLLLTGLVDGRAGYHDLLARLFRWRVGLRWYALALLTAPVVYGTVGLALSLVSPAYLPRVFAADDKATLLLLGTVVGLVGGLVEELGWTGFAIPRLRRGHGVLATGLLVGVLWGAWHLLTNDFWSSSIEAGGIPLALFVAVRGLDLLLGGLPAYRLLMVWAYDRTGSLLVPLLLHASLIACNIVVLAPVATAGTPLLTWLLVTSAATWIVAGAVTVASRRPGAIPVKVTA